MSGGGNSKKSSKKSLKSNGNFQVSDLNLAGDIGEQPQDNRQIHIDNQLEPDIEMNQTTIQNNMALSLENQQNALQEHLAKLSPNEQELFMNYAMEAVLKDQNIPISEHVSNYAEQNMAYSTGAVPEKSTLSNPLAVDEEMLAEMDDEAVEKLLQDAQEKNVNKALVESVGLFYLSQIPNRRVDLWKLNLIALAEQYRCNHRATAA